MKNIKNTITKHLTALMLQKDRIRAKLQEENGQFVMDHAVVFVLIIVLAGIALVLLTSFLQNDLSTTLRTKIMEFFT